jgi:hypothetical protein
MLNYILAVPLIGHGLAHISGFIASWTRRQAGFYNNPWLLSNGVKLNSPLGKLFGLLWLAAAAALSASGVGLILMQDWWMNAAIAGAVISLVVIVPWWRTVPPGARIGAAFDLLILAVLFSPLKDLFN